jgi:hypothetical protein
MEGRNTGDIYVDDGTVQVAERADGATLRQAVLAALGRCHRCQGVSRRVDSTLEGI